MGQITLNRNFSIKILERFSKNVYQIKGHHPIWIETFCVKETVCGRHWAIECKICQQTDFKFTLGLSDQCFSLWTQLNTAAGKINKIYNATNKSIILTEAKL